MAQINEIINRWDRLKKFPAGTWLFSKMLGHMTPYSGTINARVLKLEQGMAQVELKERRAVRNHLNSIHAIALINLGELATGLAALTTIDKSMRGIVVNIGAEYVKKARGKLIATSHFQLPDVIEDNTPCSVIADIRDQSNDVVCIVTATWLLGYRETK